jgi:sigma-E factor negative regulatory protein RseC
MTQIATIEKLLDADHAEIAVARKSACGHDCEECAGCGVSGASVYARASNPIGAKPGQKVVVESSTKNMMGIILLVYMVPVALFFLGYFLTASLLPTAGQYVTAVIAFVLGLIPAVIYDRRLRRRGGLDFTIIRFF